MELLDKNETIKRLKERIAQMQAIDPQAARKLEKLLEKMEQTPGKVAV